MDDEEKRPDPDALLARVQREERSARRGKFKIFLGANAGVGKTYGMLLEARSRKASGTDVIVGLVETHGRKETEALIEGLEALPRKVFHYKGMTLKEFDLAAALERKPQLIIVDELAHTNVPGSLHDKRWQDIAELLAAGIDVYTALNIQHVESLNDVVGQITGVVVRETVPDSALDLADEIELVDLPAEDLLVRLKEGKVYLTKQAELAADNFFKKSRLTALRELALREVARRVDKDVQQYRSSEARTETWPVTERIIACVSASPNAVNVVRAAKRIADRVKAEWITLFVETPSQFQLSRQDREYAIKALQLGEQLGSETVSMTGFNVADEIIHYARLRNATRIVVGKPLRRTLRDRIFGSIIDRLALQSGEIEIHAIRGEVTSLAPVGPEPTEEEKDSDRNTYAYFWTTAAVAIVTLFGKLVFGYLNNEIILIFYLLLVVGASSLYRRGPSIWTTVLSVACYDFFFVPPYLRFTVHDSQYIIVFFGMAVTGILISTLTIRNRDQAELARDREHRTGALYSMLRDLAGTTEIRLLLDLAVQHVGMIFESEAAILLPDAGGRLIVRAGKSEALASSVDHQRIADWAFQNGKLAGLGTGTLEGTAALYVPLISSTGPIGVLYLRPAEAHKLIDPTQRHLLETFAHQIAVALERERYADETRRAQTRVEAEQVRNTLLSSVSHDLRTPLATITGAASSLLEKETRLAPDVQHDLLLSIYQDAQRLDRLVGDLLDMTRLETPHATVNKELQPIEEVIGSTLARLDPQLKGRTVKISVPSDLPMVPIDAVLIEQVISNLVENALNYTPPESPLEVSAKLTGNEVAFEVADRGPGLAQADLEKVFDKFYRGPTSSSRPGTGLGLAICKAVVMVHGGRIWAENRPGGGAVFRFTLPIPENAPVPGPYLD